MNKDNLYEIVLDIDGEIEFIKDKVFYYKVMEMVNEYIDVTIKENGFKKVIELK